MKYSQASIEALNAIDATPWVINRTIVEAVRFALSKGEPIAGLIDTTPGSKRDIAIQGQARRALSIADDIDDGDLLYFPHTFDHRSRVYPQPEVLNPQAAGPIKAMLTFPSEPLTQDGAMWLKRHCASMYGLDKLGMKERQQWSDDNRDIIIAISDDYQATYDFWKEASEPFQFLEAALQLGQFMKEELT